MASATLYSPENLVISQMPEVGFDVVILKLHNYQAVFFFLIDHRLLFLFELGAVFLYARDSS